MRALGAELARELRRGDLVLLYGLLGTGKTTLVRGLLSELGVEDPVRSPTFNLVQLFDTDPPVAHIDLFRLETSKGLGLEDTFETHLVLIEWGDRLEARFGGAHAWRIRITFEGEGRSVMIERPD